MLSTVKNSIDSLFQAHNPGWLFSGHILLGGAIPLSVENLLLSHSRSEFSEMNGLQGQSQGTRFLEGPNKLIVCTSLFLITFSQPHLGILGLLSTLTYFSSLAYPNHSHLCLNLPTILFFPIESQPCSSRPPHSPPTPSRAAGCVSLLLQSPPTQYHSP